MINDRLTSGAIAGMTGAIALIVTHFIFNIIGVTSYTFPSLIATIFLKVPVAENHSFGPFLLGLFIHIVNGGSFEIIINYILKMVGERYLWFKGFLFSILIWLIGPTILLPLFYPGFPLSFHYVSLVDHLIFGFVTVYLIDKLYPVKD